MLVLLSRVLYKAVRLTSGVLHTGVNRTPYRNVQARFRRARRIFLIRAPVLTLVGILYRLQYQGCDMGCEWSLQLDKLVANLFGIFQKDFKLLWAILRIVKVVNKVKVCLPTPD